MIIQAEEIRKAHPSLASNYNPRPVGKDELKEKRGEVEDYLRTAVLAGTTWEPLLKDLRDVLNRPWDEAGIKYFGDLLVVRSNERIYASRGGMRVDIVEWGNIAKLLAFVATTHRDQAVGKLAAEEFDRALAWLLEAPGIGIRWDFAMDAIGEYGSTDMMTPTFWRGFDGGQTCSSALAVADAVVLAKLKAYRERNPTLYFRYEWFITKIEERLKDPNQARNSDIGIAFRKASIPIRERRYQGVETNTAIGNPIRTNAAVVGK